MTQTQVSLACIRINVIFAYCLWHMIVKCTTDMDQNTHTYIYIYVYNIYSCIYFETDTFKIFIYVYIGSINEYVYNLQSNLRSTCKRLNATCFRHTCIQSQNKTKQTSGKSFHTCFLVAIFFCQGMMWSCLYGWPSKGCLCHPAAPGKFWV